MALALTVLSVFKEADGALRDVKDVLYEKFVKPKEIIPRVDPVSFESKLTPVFNEKSMLEIDENTKIMVTMINHLLVSKLKDATDFNHVLGLFNADANLVAREKDIMTPKFEIFAQDDVSYFDFSLGASKKAKAIAAVEKWLSTTFIPDKDVRKITGLDDDKIVAGMVSFTGVQISDVLTIMSKEVEQRSILNLAIIKYPDAASPYFTLFEIKLDAWVERTILGGPVMNQQKNGLRGTFNTYTFEAKAEGIATLKPETKLKMVGTYDDFVKQVKEPIVTSPKLATKDE